MLTFHEDVDFVITETTYSFIKGKKVFVVRYKKDLSQKKVGNDPWRNTNPQDVQWFEKYYRQKFEVN